MRTTRWLRRSEGGRVSDQAARKNVCGKDNCRAAAGREQKSTPTATPPPMNQPAQPAARRVDPSGRARGAGLTLAEARKAATAALHELERGNDPAALKFEAKAVAAAAATAREAYTVEHLAGLFIEQHAKRKTRENSCRQAKHVFKNIV